MAIEFARECKFPQDMEVAALALKQEIGDRLINSLALLSDMETSVPSLNTLMDQGDDLLNQILAQNGNKTPVKTTKDLDGIFCLPPDTPTLSDREKYLGKSGIFLIDGILYPPGSVSTNSADATNIKNLRKLYLATGKDLTKTKSILASQSQISIVDSLSYQIIPALDPNRKAQDLITIRQIVGAPELQSDDTLVLDDFKTLVLIRNQFISQNRNLDELSHKTGLDKSFFRSSIFSFGSADNSVAAIQKYTDIGYTGNYISTILDGVDLIQLTGAIIPGEIKAAQNKALSTIAKMSFLIPRFDGFSTADKEKFRKELYVAIVDLETTHRQLTSDAFFEVTIIEEADTLTNLLKFHTEEKVIEILEQRLDITGLWFNAPDNKILEQLTQSATVTPGSTFTSNKCMNAGTDNLTQLKNQLIIMQSYLYYAKKAIQTELSTKAVDIQVSHEWLVTYAQNSEAASFAASANNPTTSASASSASATIFQGQPSTATPSGILAGDFSSSKTFDTAQRIADVNNATDGLTEFYPPAVAKAFARIINIVTDIFEGAMKAIDFIMDKAKNLVLAFKNRLDSFLSKFLTLTGSGSFEGSILKCLNFKLSLPALDNLLAFLDQIQSLLSTFLGKMAAWLSDILERIICLPLNLINAFLGSSGTSCLIPSFGGSLAPANFKLNSSLRAALERLKSIATSKGFAMTTLSRDLVTLKLTVNAAPGMQNQFKRNAFCDSVNVGNFINASALNVGA